ncbi:MAG: SAM-dependent DNA methyltransferase [Lachnospiraceae bacterium]|nr:SAM-dependent DNA methyltransferase [Lachnospiraceae bacterium]
MGYEEYLDSVKRMIDDLKAMTADLGLANTGDEYKIISELFTYKFLNDKLLYEFEQREDKSESFEDFVDYADSGTARIKEDHLLTNLFQKQNDPKFHKLFDKALETVSELNKDVYSIETSTGQKKPLMEPLAVYLRDEDKENELAKRAINILCKYKFEDIYAKGWDYFSTIFEYLIKDFNKDSGKYAEYFTPAFAGSIMASILYNDTPVDKVTIYDPAAGSGTLLLSMANVIGVKNCTLYSQDRAQKSTQFLRINLILNNLAHSLANVVEGNTMTSPAHLDGDRLKGFDFIVSNPPFNVDFSADVEEMKTDKYNRFFAGIPNIPNKDKSDMAIYLTFLQHILASLSKTGKAAVVVPTGFLDKNKRSSKIAYEIRKRIVDQNWLVGTISMPSNIFATTGTNVSILFIDKTKTDDGAFFLDASKFGTKVSLDDGQRTLLSDEEIAEIINIFKSKKIIEDVSVYVDNDAIAEKDYSYTAGQYFKAKMEFVELTEEDFKEEIRKHKECLNKLFSDGKILQDKIVSGLGELIYEKM